MKKTLQKVGGLVLGLGVVAAAAFGGASVAVDVEETGARCQCPALWAPVKCSNGKTYPNQCYADCHKAKGCVPTGDL